PVCSPNRATYMTGLIPSQHGVHNWLGGEKPDAQVGPEAYCTISEFATLPRVLADEGYACGLSGKWHLGDSLSPQLGFGYWFTKPRGHTRTFWNSEAIWQGEIYREPRYYLDAITDHARNFLRQDREEPFFLHVGYNGPYGLDQDMRDSHRNRHSEHYADKPLTCFPRGETHPWLVQNRDCMNNLTTMRSYASAVSGVDDGVGTILDTLDELSIAENTLVIYTADHGLCAGHNGVWGMGDHSRPRHMFQQNLRVPLLLRHPEAIAGGGVIDEMSCTYDFFPSMLDYLELEQNADLPGRSYAPALRGDGLDWDDEVTFHEYEETRTAQTPEWKLIRRHPEGPNELYDMVNDPGERVNLIDQPDHATPQASLDARLSEFFATHADPEYDMWAGGRTKAGKLV
ncbi:MAG TPA: sulfatase-like hydrolase/transferase, partial [Armatimonadota bacterium]|nr:sulfatase-like hydrolase/transferase [Armatimonadota bacterium]